MLLLGRKTARGKVVSSIVSLSRRAEQRGYGPSPVSLPMNRADIADYLGLTTDGELHIHQTERIKCDLVAAWQYGGAGRSRGVSGLGGRRLACRIVLLHRNKCIK